ncbi:hypothetical protein N9S87_02180 [Synechococcus sp. AH-779-G23]|nr:hypothetical protein [Synechococcus sp. AH-779-G23]
MEGFLGGLALRGWMPHCFTGDEFLVAPIHGGGFGPQKACFSRSAVHAFGGFAFQPQGAEAL